MGSISAKPQLLVLALAVLAASGVGVAVGIALSSVVVKGNKKRCNRDSTSSSDFSSPLTVYI